MLMLVGDYEAKVPDIWLRLGGAEVQPDIYLVNMHNCLLTCTSFAHHVSASIQ
jgi:hypothetical protein